MNKQVCSLALGLIMAISVPFCAFANQPVDEVACTTKQNETSEQTILEGIGRDGSVVWTYGTDLAAKSEKGNVSWYGQSGNLFFLNFKGSLQAFDTLTGDILWSTPEGEYDNAHGIFDGSGNLCMVSVSGPITLLDRSGNILARFNTDKKYSSLIVNSMVMKDNHLTLKYAAEGFGADTKAFNDYNTMPSLTVNLTRYQSQVKITIDEQAVTFDVPPFIEQNRTFVPVRAIFEALGAEVSWDGTTKTVTAQKDGTTVTLVIGKKEITVNGMGKTLDIAPQIVHDRTLVPARAVSEAFGYNVGWDGESKTVLITTSVPQPEELTVDPAAFSYIGQTYKELSDVLGPVSQVNWYNGPIASLEGSAVWMGFGDGSWYQSNTDYYLSGDIICTSVITNAGKLFPNMSASTTLTEIAQALNAEAPQPTTDEDGNITALFSYQGKDVTVYMADQESVNKSSLILIQ